MNDYAQDLQAQLRNNLRLGFSPTDCNHCYVASTGVAGEHYSCDCKKSTSCCVYPLIMRPSDCEFYEKEAENE